MLELIEEVLKIAKAEVGVEETAENWGNRVGEYLRRTGYDDPQPWCAAFLYWCINQAAGNLGQSNPFIRTGYCPSVHSWAVDRGILKETPQVGDVFLIYRYFSDPPPGIDAFHTGFVTGVSGAKFYTVEGNTNLDGSAEGFGVFARERYNSDSYKFVRWGNLVKSSVPPAYALYINGIKVADCPIIRNRAWMPIRRVAEELGYSVDWNNALQLVLLNGKEFIAETVLIDSKAFCRVTSFAEFTDMRLSVDDASRKLVLSN